jgi:hypothetical protein
MTRADLIPTLWLSGPGGRSGFEPILEVLEGAESHGADLGRLTVCVSVASPPGAEAGSGRSALGEALAGLRGSVPASVSQVVVVLPRVRLHLAQGDAFELADAVARQSFPWPVGHCAGDLALRQVGGWWREPGLAPRAGNRFETILGQLASPTGPVYVRRHEQGADEPAPVDVRERRARRVFDTSLFRRRSLYRSPTSEAGQTSHGGLETVARTTSSTSEAGQT